MEFRLEELPYSDIDLDVCGRSLGEQRCVTGGEREDIDGTVSEVVWLSKADNEDDDDDVASDVDSPEDSVIIGGAKAGLDAFFKNFIFFTLSWKRDDKPGLRLD
jgi:hypothetical protein